MAEIQVLHDVEVVAERQVLVDGGDAEFGRVARGVDVDFFAVPIDMTAGRLYMPAMVLMSVDFPAPLSPISAVTCPAGTSRSTS